jgi:hypothetical protein
LDPITDIFRTMHVTAFGLHRLEATAPWGLIQEKENEEKVTPSDKKMSPTDLAHFAMPGAPGLDSETGDSAHSSATVQSRQTPWRPGRDLRLNGREPRQPLQKSLFAFCR